MLEAIIVGFIVFAVGYAGLMRLMARRADVLHGEFILSQTSPRPEPSHPFAGAISRVIHGVRSLARR